jgi:hypothetical protein
MGSDCAKELEQPRPALPLHSMLFSGVVVASYTPFIIVIALRPNALDMMDVRSKMMIQ